MWQLNIKSNNYAPKAPNLPCHSGLSGFSTGTVAASRWWEQQINLIKNTSYSERSTQDVMGMYVQFMRHRSAWTSVVSSRWSMVKHLYALGMSIEFTKYIESCRNLLEKESQERAKRSAFLSIISHVCLSDSSPGARVRMFGQSTNQKTW